MVTKSTTATFSILLTLLSVVFCSTAASGSPSPRFGPWGQPVNMGPVLNSDGDDAAAVLADNGRTIYFTSTRKGSLNRGEDIWVATRRNKHREWSEPRPISAVNTSWLERLRSISPDGRIMVFQSDRPGGVGGFDIWVSVRKNRSDDLDWSEPVNLGSVVNSGAAEIAGNYVFGTGGRGHKFFISSSRSDLGGLGQGDIYVSEIPEGGSFGPLVNVTELNSPFIETCFWVRQDNLEIIFSSTRDGGNNDPASFDLWTSKRESEFDAWSPPVSLGNAIDAQGYQDVNPDVSGDGTTMTFSSRRPNPHGPTGNMDLYITTRLRLR